MMVVQIPMLLQICQEFFTRNINLRNGIPPPKINCIVLCTVRSVFPIDCKPHYFPPIVNGHILTWVSVRVSYPFLRKLYNETPGIS
jgi:hypothetical protein